MGLGEFCQSARRIDLERLIEQFTTLENQAEQLRQTMMERNQSHIRHLEQQFTALSAALFPVREPAPVPAGHEASHEDNR
jgi:hypothetical protein